jgi:CBS domain-containing protein
MNVSEAMTPEVRLVRPEQTIREAARLMSELDIGALPVHENDRLVGMLTDRDIAVRAVADGLNPDTPIREVMSAEIMYCFEDQPIEEVAENMSEQRLRRLPVLNRSKRLVGILSLADIASDEEFEEEAWEALSGISRPGGEHSQAMQHH